MKKLILVTLFLVALFVLTTPLFALMTTENVDKDKFDYEVAFTFATSDMGTSYTAQEIPVSQTTSMLNNFYYVVPRDGSIVGISVAGNIVLGAGAATFDVTINGTVTGVQTVIEYSPVRTALGNSGASGSQYAYMRQDRAETASSQGFRQSSDKSDYHNVDNPFGRATPVSAGDRIGVKVTTNSGLSPTTADYVVTVYVLE